MLFMARPGGLCADIAKAVQTTHQQKSCALVPGGIQKKYSLVRVPLFFQLSQQGNRL